MDTQEFASIVAQYAPVLGSALVPLTGGSSAAIGTIIGAIATTFGASTKEPLSKIADCINSDSKNAEKLLALQVKHCNVGAFPE